MHECAPLDFQQKHVQSFVHASKIFKIAAQHQLLMLKLHTRYCVEIMGFKCLRCRISLGVCETYTS